MMEVVSSKLPPTAPGTSMSAMLGKRDCSTFGDWEQPVRERGRNKVSLSMCLQQTEVARLI